MGTDRRGSLHAPKGVHVWEWRNESNWAGTNVPVATYTAELKAAYTAIHQADPCPRLS